MTVRPLRFARGRLRPLVGASLALISSAALTAQTPAAAPAPAAQEEVALDQFVVTGTLLPQAADASLAPVAVFTPMEMTAFGAANAAEALRSIPSFFGDASTELDSNGGTGRASANLRALNGTLTLVNGRRSGGFSDLNSIPLAAIERIEVLKDGAGAVYGADALSGVVNIILKKDYDGVEFSTGYGATTHGDGTQWQASVVAGKPFASGKDHVVVVANRFEKDTIYADDRAVSHSSDNRADGGIFAGSSTFPGRIDLTDGTQLILRDGVGAPASLADYREFDFNNDAYDFRSTSPSIPGQDRTSFHLAADYQVSEAFQPFVELTHTRQITDNGLAASPIFIEGDLLDAAKAGPYLPVDADTLDLIRYRTVPLGNRLDHFDKRLTRALAGARGRFLENWNYEIAAGRIRTEEINDLMHDVTVDSLLPEIESGAFNPFATAATGTLNGSSWDNTAALLRAERQGRVTDTTDLDMIDAKVSGPLFALPAGDLMLALGGELNRTRLTREVDATVKAGELLGFGSASESESRRTTRAAFGELVVPLASKDHSAPLLHALDFTLGGRTDRIAARDLRSGDSATFNSANARAGLRYQPVEAILIRSSYGTGFRAPTLGNLYGGSGWGYYSTVDPLHFTSGAEIPVLTSANSNLDPERSRSLSVGTVITIPAVKGLSLSVDYYHTKLTGTIANAASFYLKQNALDQGSSFVPGDPSTINPDAVFSDRIFRYSDGSIDYLDVTSMNLDRTVSDGLDFELHYRGTQTSLGRFSHTLAAHHVLSYDVHVLPGSPAESYVGRFIDPYADPMAPGSVPKWRGYYDLTWSLGDLTLDAKLNYVHSLQDDPAFVDLDGDGITGELAATNQGHGNDQHTIPSWTTFDLRLSYDCSKLHRWLSGVTVAVGAVNLFDKGAPLTLGAFNDDYDTSLHSNRGRFLYTDITLHF